MHARSGFSAMLPCLLLPAVRARMFPCLLLPAVHARMFPCLLLPWILFSCFVAVPCAMAVPPPPPLRPMAAKDWPPHLHLLRARHPDGRAAVVWQQPVGVRAEVAASGDGSVHRTAHQGRVLTRAGMEAMGEIRH